MLNKEELERYSRQLILSELGLTGQQKLKQAKVLVIGAGGLGCPVLQYLAAAGVGTMGIVDADVVDISNLHRQILYSSQDVGTGKALVAKAKLQQLNPYVQINAYPQRLTQQNAEDIVKRYDLVIDGSDNFPTRYLVNDICVALQKPLVFGSIFKFEGQVSVFNYQDGPGYRDLFPDSPGEGEMPNCADIGVIGVLPGMVAMLMASETIKMICGFGEVLSGKLLTINALNGEMQTFVFTRQINNDSYRPVGETRGHFEPATQKVKEIDTAQLRNWLIDKNECIILVDVRERYEFDEFNIGGVNIPLGELTGNISMIPANGKIIFCCKSGVRSNRAGEIFINLRGQECYHLKDGILNFS